MDKPVITKEVECRIGRDYQTHMLFINELHDLDTEIADIAVQKLGVSPAELHSLTSNLVSMQEKSKYGGGHHGLTLKVLRLKLEIKINNCELIDDEVKTKEESE